MPRFLTALALALTTSFPAIAQAQQSQQPGYGSHMWDGNMGWFFGPLMMIVFIAALVAIVILLVRWLGGPSHGNGLQAPKARAPLEILTERFARGEIDKQEFEERRRVLED